MEAYAALKDLQARWREITDEDEAARAKQKLSDASLLIDGECMAAGVTLDLEDELTAATLTMIVCEMVKRAMIASVDQAPITQGGVTVGPFAVSQTYANPHGDLYLTKAEKKRLGIGCQRVGFAHPWGDVE